MLEILPHLWKKAVISKQFVLLEPSTQSTIHALVAQAIPGINLDEVHARECAFKCYAELHDRRNDSPRLTLLCLKIVSRSVAHTSLNLTHYCV